METVVSSEFDIFAPKPVQSSIVESNEVHYKPVAGADQDDLEFLIPSDSETYIDPNIRLYVRGKLTKVDGTNLDDSDITAVTNNFQNSLFSQCHIAINGTNVTPSADLYPYRSFFEIALTYGRDAAA
jgi:hypothetical protein